MRKLLVYLTFLVTLVAPGLAQKASKVMVMEIKSDIDPRTNRYVELALEQAEEIGADVVIIEMDTYGGLVADAKDIVENILDFEKPVWVFIDKDAASAGALISIACDSIYMAAGSSIGAATVVVGDGTQAPDKYQSYMRSTMRSTAEEKGRDPKIAEGMVDQNIEIEGVTKAGEVITFSTSEAIEHGFCEAKVTSIEEILERNGIEKYDLIRYELNITEKIIAFFLNPFISGILILVIIGGLYFELQTPGVGFPILAAAIALVLYLVPYYLNGLAESWEIIAFIVGIILIALEVFVIPGFGLAGVSGLILTVGSLVLMMLNNDVFDFTLVPFDKIFIAISTTLGGLLGGVIIMFFGGVRLANSKMFSRIALTSTEKRSEGYTSSFIKESMIGKTGEAYTVLRPSGKVLIEDEIFDAYTRGGYIHQGAKIKVIGEEGTSLKVKQAD
ncbi:MAG: nodulation protein NfeD [Cyclobacteriaceae bacterium]|nr:nodulation protein NfeD [Cyclobacteriaceae bacterium]